MPRLALLLALLAAPAALAQQPYTLVQPMSIPTGTAAQFTELDLAPTLDLAIASGGSAGSSSSNGDVTFPLYQPGFGDNFVPIPGGLGEVYTEITGFAIADFVGGGLQPVDGVVLGTRTGQGTASITTLINKGFPFVPLTVEQELATGIQAGRVVQVADLSGDGILDIAAFFTNASGTGQAVYYPGDGADVFGTARTIAAPNRLVNVEGAAVADVDSDGDLDVLTASQSEVLAFLNTGSGSFGAPVVIDAALASAQDVAVADINRDGNPDAVAAGASGVIAYYAGNGAGGFGSRFTVTDAATGATRLDLGDVDADGDVDIGAAEASRFTIYLNFASGRFTEPYTVVTGSDPTDILIGDIDQDGDGDVVTIDRGGTSGFYRKTSQGFPVSSEDGAAPSEDLGLSVYPNPVGADATVLLRGEAGGAVRVRVVDVLGREVAVLHDGPTTTLHPLRLDASQLPAGVYLLQAHGLQGSVSHPLTVVR
ncbi:MAG: FG-GAP-like repeat-containing protein [Bacteroidota bacterium]